MAYFPDLSPYAYGHGTHPNTVHVGWLDNIHPFPKGKVEPHLVERIKKLAAKPTELYRGFHVCELCVEPPDVKKVVSGTGLIDTRCSWWEWAAKRRGNGEIRVSADSITFAAPVLVVHYIQEHQYLPPALFLQAVEAASLGNASGQ